MKILQDKWAWLLIFSLFFCFHFSLTVAEAGEEQEEVKKQGMAPPEEKEEKKNLATFIQYETTFSKSLVDLKNQLGGVVDPQRYQAQIADISMQIDDLEWQIQMAKTDINMAHEQLAVFDLKLNREELQLKKIAAPLTVSIQMLSDWEVDWLGKKVELVEWEKAISPGTTFSMVLENIENLMHTTLGALELIDNKLKPSIKTGQKISSLQVRTYALVVDVGALINERKEIGVEQTMPAVFSAEFIQFMDSNLFQTVLERTKRSLQNFKVIAEEHSSFLLLNFIGLMILAFSIKYSGRFVKPSEKWFFFTRKPLVVATFFLLLFYLIFHFALSGTLISFEAILQVFLSITVILLMPIFSGYSSKELWLLRAFVLLLIITWMFDIFNLPTPLIQIFVAISSLCMIFCSLWHSWYLQKHKKKRKRVILLRLVTIPFAVSLFGMLLGYESFAHYVFTSLLIAVVAARVVALIYLFAIAVLELILKQIPYRVVQENRLAIVNRLVPVVGLLSGLLYLFILLKDWQIYPTREAAAHALLSMEIVLAGINISPKMILLTVGTVYIVYMFSKAIQKILLDSILPKYHVELGVQLSMVRLIHYSILIVGFVVLLNLLGFELTKLTIIGGALGVGIGFGLQAIVNNFASGLILLFERPIKVGDTVQIGNDLGEVKKLGLRATVVSTFDNAEIVIPNSDLITAPVTNWTLSGRKARLKVPVGVAYGTDIQKVLEILMRCAHENTQVLTQPQPTALFLAFGASSLDIELRVWIPNFSDRRQVLSALNQEIESEFSQAGIEIPFPQADLHVRSIDEHAAAALRGGGG